MWRATRHWWGSCLPTGSLIEWSLTNHVAARARFRASTCGKTLDGRAGRHVIGMACLGCGVVSIDEESVDALDPDVRRELADVDW